MWLVVEVLNSLSLSVSSLGEQGESYTVTANISRRIAAKHSGHILRALLEVVERRREEKEEAEGCSEGEQGESYPLVPGMCALLVGWEMPVLLGSMPCARPLRCHSCSNLKGFLLSLHCCTRPF